MVIAILLWVGRWFGAGLAEHSGMNPLLQVGTCGLPKPKAKLAELFSVAEVQQTFYQPPQIKTLEKWRTEVPAEFEFTIKAWQLITHESKSPTYRKLKSALTSSEAASAGSFRPSEIVTDAWKLTARCAEALGANKVLFQCPASFGPSGENLENLRRFFTEIDRNGLILLWEPRGPAWHDETILELCNELDLIHVVDPFVRPTVTPQLTYYRLHGRGGHRYQYEEAELSDLLSSLPGDVPSYVMFNNVYMLEDGVRLLDLLRRR